jgi:hypothetical protein
MTNYNYSRIYQLISAMSSTTWSGSVSYSDSYPKLLFNLPANSFVNRVDFYTNTTPSGVSYGPVDTGNADGGGSTTNIITAAQIPNDSVLTKISIYTSSAISIKLKLASKVSLADTVFDIVDLETVAHSGGGWQTFTLSVPQEIPSDRYWYPSFYVVGGAVLNNNYTSGGTVDRYISADVAGRGLASSASSGHRHVSVSVAPVLTLTASGVTGHLAVGIHPFSNGPAFITEGSLMGSILSKTSPTPIYLNTLLTPIDSVTGDLFISYGSSTPSEMSPFPSILTASQASRPTTATQGSLFIPTDGYYQSIYNGSGWDTYVGGFKCINPPDPSALTAVNFGSAATLVDDSDGLLATMMGTNSTGYSAVLALVSVPSAPYRFIVGIDLWYLHPTRSSMFGICITDGTSNPKIMPFRADQATRGLSLNIITNSNLTTWQSTRYDNYAPPPITSCRFFLQIYDDATSRNFMLSKNGTNWQTLYSCSRTDYLTPTHCGLFMDQGAEVVATNTIRVQAKIFHWYLGV